MAHQVTALFSAIIFLPNGNQEVLQFDILTFSIRKSDAQANVL